MNIECLPRGSQAIFIHRPRPRQGEGVPPPILCEQVPSIHGLTERAPLQVPLNKELGCRVLSCKDLGRFCRLFDADGLKATFLHCSYCAPAAANDWQNCATNSKPESVPMSLCP